MEKTTKLAPSLAVKSYIELTKPGIIMGNAITAFGGLTLASRGHINFMLFIMTLLGLSLVIASACVCNNYIDRDLDKKMVRTRNRALAKGTISVDKAIQFAMLLGIAGVVILFVYANLMATVAALLGFFVYVLFYSFSKYLTPACTLIGSIAGAIPPVVGYCAVTNRLDLCAFLIFLTIVLWQMPHFYAIAMFRLRDYTNASVPVLPVKKGILTTKIHMLFYIVAFTFVSSLLTYFKYTGTAYLVITLAVGTAWFIYAIKGFKCKSDAYWARKMFLLSLVVVLSLCAVIPFSSI
ncbi:protoheme IX farnesyltransferase [Candidatus Aerophobetes bacterium]|uniref:Protoheme IX farnesyltransferase n=1 Tax=Aerophobetes bacterium TaxID=2030807 RepID=A0A2A4YBE8_UNCAE|nr:MAG: protoheme IX farnesyltransferase [Candidatus Aerophobetes bacterium]